jgi:pimeloyl-ACP methyl ester carboxylesterase
MAMPHTTTSTVELTAGPVDVHTTGTGEPLLLLGPALTDETYWDAVVPLLVERGHRCVVPTMPLGCHLRPLHPDADLTPPALAALVVELIDALDLAPATIVSNDSCTAITQIVLTTRPEKVRAAVLSSGDAYEDFLPPRFRPLVHLAKLPGSMHLMARIMRSSLLTRSPLAFGHLTLRGLTEAERIRWSTPLRTDAGVRHDLAKAFRGVHNRYTLEAATHFGEVQQPVLVLWGGTRNAFSLRLGERLAADLPNARLEVVQESSAFLPLDAPEAMAEAIDRFVAEVAAGRGAASAKGAASGSASATSEEGLAPR